jgi:hypothetical protein
VKPFQGAPQLFQFAFITRLLPFGLFERLQHPFHFIQHFSQLLNHVLDILNRFVNRRTLFAKALLILPRRTLIPWSTVLLRRLWRPSRRWRRNDFGRLNFFAHFPTFRSFHGGGCNQLIPRRPFMGNLLPGGSLSLG